MGEPEGVSYISAKGHNLYLFWDFLTIRAEWNRNPKFVVKVFIFSAGCSHSFKPPFLAIIKRWFSLTATGGTYKPMQAPQKCLFHSTLLQDLANWKIILNYIPRFGWKGDKSLQVWDEIHPEKREEAQNFFSIENECFRGNWHFPEESLGNWVWNLCISP